MADDVKVSIVADIKSLLTGLDSASKATKKTTEEMSLMGRDVGETFNKLKGAFIALAAVVGGAVFLKSAVKETVEWTVESQKLARVLGITTEQASVLNLAIGDIYGTSEGYLGAVSKLTKTLNSNEGAFTRLGVATRDSNGHLRSTPDIMTDVNTALSQIKSGTDRNIESQRIYGKSWIEVQRYLDLTAEVMQAAKEKAEKLNLVVGQDSVRATAAYRASMNDLEDTVKGLKIRIGNELLPVLTTLNQDMADEGPSAVEALGTAFKWFYGIILGLREELAVFLANIKYMWNDMVLGAQAWKLQLNAILRCSFDEAIQIEKAYRMSQRDLAFATAQEIHGIQEKFTAKAMSLWGLGPKKSGSVAPTGGAIVGTGASSGTGSAADEKSKADPNGLTSSQNADAKAAANYAKKIAQDKAEYLNDKSREEVESQRKAIADIKAAWEKNTATGGMMAYLRETKAAMKEWGGFTKTMLQGIEGAFSSTFKGILSGQMTVSQAMRNLWRGLTDAIMGMFAEMLAKWVMSKLAELIIGKATATSEAAGGAAAYAVAAMQSVAAIPMVGWAMAPGVGAAAYGLGMSYAALASAAGGWDRVPSDQMAMIHKNEMVLPANLAEGARQTFAGGGGGMTVHIHTVDKKGIESLIKNNQGLFIKAANENALNRRTK